MLSREQAFLIYNVDLIDLKNKAESDLNARMQLLRFKQDEFIKRDVFNQLNEKKWANFFLK